jgi:hypothetical protein
MMPDEQPDALDRYLGRNQSSTQTPVGQDAAGIAEALALGINETLIQTFPEMKKIFDLFAAGNRAQARLEYFNSDYYKNLTNASAQRKTNKATRPGVYAQEFDAWKQAQIVRLAQKGIRMTPTIESMLESSYLAGDTDLQLDIKILDSGKLGIIGGSTLGAVNTLKDLADDQGVNGILGSAYWKKVSEGLLAGTLTADDVTEEIKSFAISAYPAYAQGIQAGRSFNLQTSALRQTVANLLEKDVDTITNDNPVFKSLVGYINPATGKQEQIPLWEAEKKIKSTDEWLYTKNAQATFDNLGRTVLRDYGVAY